MNIPVVFQTTKEGVILRLHVQPGSSREGFSGIYNGRVRLRLKAKALDGLANQSLRSFLAQFFSVSKSCITLLAGEKSRQKTVLILADAQKIEKIEQQILSTIVSAGQDS